MEDRAAAAQRAVSAIAIPDAATAQIGVSVASLFPDISLAGTLGVRNLSPGYLFDWDSKFYTFGPSISLPIFHGGALSAERRAAQDEYQAAFAAYRQTVLNAFSQVAASLQALGNDAESLLTQQRALESASASLALTTQAYKAGNAGYVQVLDAQRLHQQAQLGEGQAYRQRYVDAVKLLLAAGGRVDSSPNR